MNGSHTRRLSLVAASVALALGSTATLAQESDESAEEVLRAEDRLDRAEEALDRAEERVELRADELDAARDVAEESEETVAADSAEDDTSDLDDILDEHANLSTFVEALELTGLDATLTNGTDYTVFAPTNDAFAEEDDDLDLMSSENRDELIELLRAHIVADHIDPERARTLDQALTVDGGIVDIDEHDGELMIGDARVVNTHAHGDNLHIFVIDEVLEPDPSASAAALRERDDVDD